MVPTPSPLFRHLRFCPTLTLSAQQRAELTQLIENNGGELSATPADAAEIVDDEKLDARHPERVSIAFIEESVACGALMDAANYSGAIFTAAQRSRGPKRRKMEYTLEEDARMLHFAKVRRGWKSMESVPESAWREAEKGNVTRHTSQSMHEHFRKQLQRKTVIEQRVIMAKAAATLRAQLLEQEREEEELEEEEPPARKRASPSSTGFRDAAAPESTASTPARVSRRTPNSATQQEPAISESSTVGSRLKEVAEERFGRKGTRSRKPTSPLRISQRIRRSEGRGTVDKHKSSGESLVSPPPSKVSPALNATPATPVTSATSTTPATPATSEVRAARSILVASASSSHRSTAGSQSAGKRQQKQKRSTPSSGDTNSRGTPSEVEDSDAERVGSKSGGANVTFFRSVLRDLIADPSKRQMLQGLFEFPAQANRAESVASDPSEVESTTTSPVREGRIDERQQPRPTVKVEQATDEEAENIIAQLRQGTQQDMQTVVKALYDCSGDVEMAGALLNGALPSGVWSPVDDLLLVHLVAEEGTNRATVEAAVARGDFATMQVPRDTDAILRRVQFLR